MKLLKQANGGQSENDELPVGFDEAIAVITRTAEQRLKPPPVPSRSPSQAPDLYAFD